MTSVFTLMFNFKNRRAYFEEHHCTKLTLLQTVTLRVRVTRTNTNYRQGLKTHLKASFEQKHCVKETQLSRKYK